MILDRLLGIGLRGPHYHQIIKEQPKVGWFEVHSENFFYQNNYNFDLLLSIRETYPISLHGVGLSLGSFGGVDQNHLQRLKNLVETINPFLISEHLSWSSINGVYLPDLLPIPYTTESMDIFIKNINITQDFLNREILIENPSSYLEYTNTEMLESEFIVSIAENTGAKILLDLNNIYVSCSNHNWNAKKYIDSIPKGLVKEIHLAGHTVKENIKIDTHNEKVCDPVWDLYGYAISKFGNIPTLLEWDTNIPELNVLIKEICKAKKYLNLNKKNNKEQNYAAV